MPYALPVAYSRDLSQIDFSLAYMFSDDQTSRLSRTDFRY